MQYQTITLKLLEAQPQIHDQLKNTGALLAALHRYSRDLRTSHLCWTDLLGEKMPGSDPSMIASKALEIALRELEQRLSSELLAENGEPLTLDAAMDFLQPHTPPA